MGEHVNSIADTAPEYVYRAPVMPDRKRRDWGRVVDRSLLSVASAVTFGVGNWSIATTLTDAGAPLVAAVGAAGVFDLIALTGSVRVHRLRHTPHRAYGAQVTMLLSVMVSMIVNANHGWSMGGWMVATVLGAVPLAFEIVWTLQHGLMPIRVRRRFRDEVRDMTDRDTHAALFGAVADTVVPTVSLVRDNRDNVVPVGPEVVPTVPDTDSGQLALSAGPDKETAGQGVVPVESAGPDKVVPDSPVPVPVGFTRVRDRVPAVSHPGSMADEVRDLLSAGLSRPDVRSRIAVSRPDSNPDSVRRTVNRIAGEIGS